jgi:hypothetical protein
LYKYVAGREAMGQLVCTCDGWVWEHTIQKW